jgi:hypothetical protein
LYRITSHKKHTIILPSHNNANYLFLIRFSILAVNEKGRPGDSFSVKKEKPPLWGGFQGYHGYSKIRRSYCAAKVRAALDCQTVSFRCRGRWPMTTARSHLPDSPPDFTAWDCSPLPSIAHVPVEWDLGRFTALPASPCVVGLSVTVRFK